MTRRALDLSVYLVADVGVLDRLGRDVVKVVTEAVGGGGDGLRGVSTVQLRTKERSVRDQVALTCAVAACLPPDIGLVVNDRVDVVLAARGRGAPVHGVHLGQTDLDPADARRVLGPDAVVGVTTSSPAEVRAACTAGVADYLGLGAFRATATKPDAPPPLGETGLAALVSHSSLPTVAIGGLDAADVPRVQGTGVDGIAVVTAVCAAPSPRRAAARLRRAWVDGKSA